jgi:5'-nucleotidase
MPLILITNDDGVHSPGLQAAAEAAAPLGDLLIAAPRYQQTGMSRALPAGHDVGIIEETTISIHGTPHPAYGVHASPALAVVYAILELASNPPDVCISGINYGENIGMTISASGTVGAALEASVCGVPALAISRGAPLHLHRSQTYGTLDWTTAKHITHLLVERVLKNGLPPGVDALNVNVPDSAPLQAEIRPTIQSRQTHVYYTTPEARDFARGFPLPLTSTVNRHTLEPNSDIQAFLYDQVISVSPLTGRLAAPINLPDLVRYLGLQQ